MKIYRHNNENSNTIRGGNSPTDNFNESWDKKFGAPAAHADVPAEEFLLRLRDMSTFTPSK